MLTQQQALVELRNVWGECKKRCGELERDIETLKGMVIKLILMIGILIDLVILLTLFFSSTR